MRSFFAGTLHRLRLTPNRSPTRRPTIDEAIIAVWAAYSAGRITWDEAAARDEKLRHRRARIVTPFRPGAFAWRF
jgi:hypothetical protein